MKYEGIINYIYKSYKNNELNKVFTDEFLKLDTEKNIAKAVSRWIERDIAITPVVTRFGERVGELNVVNCPTCGKRLRLKVLDKRCNDCGQKLSWNGESFYKNKDYDFEIKEEIYED